MKFFYLLIALLFVLITTTAQAQQGINYQAVARDASGTMFENQNISVRFSILKDSPAGTVVYSETQSTTTNKYGLFTLAIGDGNALSGNFSQIDWNGGSMYLKVDIDATGGSNYTTIGTTQFMSVPFAFYAAKSGNGGSQNDFDTDSTNELQALSLNGNQLSLSKGGGTVTLPSNGGGDNWGTQTVQSDNTLKGEGTLASPLGIAQVGAVYGQVLQWNGSAWMPADIDNDPTNELQSLSYSNDTLKLSQNGGEVIISSGAKKLGDLSDAKTDNSSVFIGTIAGNNDDGDNKNTSIGYRTLRSNTSGSYNTASGCEALDANTTGNNNTASGYRTMNANTTGEWNSAYGYGTLSANTIGSNNTAIGGDALFYNEEGNYNVAVGNSSMLANTFGSNNIAIGYVALFSNTTGYSNVAIGIGSLYHNISSHIVAVGDSTLYHNDWGSQNAAIGSKALFSNTNGSGNTASGYMALYANTISGGNTANGNYALADNSTGSYNTACGNVALGSITTGSYNTAIGNQAGNNCISGSGNVFIGMLAGSNETGSNKLYIDNSSTSNPLIFGDFSSNYVRINIQLGVGRTPSANELEVNGTASKSTAGSWLANSDRRIKTDIRNIDNATATLMKLRPVLFRYNSDYLKIHPEIEDKDYYNFIAQEFANVFPKSVKGSGEYLDSGDEILQIDTYNAQIITIRSVQEQQKIIEEQNKKIEDLQKQIDNLRSMISD